MGSIGYHLCSTLMYGSDEIILEVGTSESPLGSTAYLSQYAPVVSLDIREYSPMLNVTHMTGDAESTLKKLRRESLGHNVRFAWLDGWDWPYLDFHPREYHELYESRGQDFTQLASAVAHMKYAELVHLLVPRGGVIAFDDTWHTVAGYDGKGGLAVPHLLNDYDYEELDVSKFIGADRVHQSLVAVRKR